MSSEQTTLLPCPFCGEDAELRGVGDTSSADCYDVFVGCTNCDAQSASWGVDRHTDGSESYAVGEVTRLWNYRADLPPGYRWIKEEVQNVES